MGNFNKKYFAIFFIALILLLVVPKPAFAISAISGIVFDPVDFIFDVLAYGKDLLNTAANIASKAQGYLEWVFKIAAEVTKRKLLNMIVDQIVQWIQGGGEPKFITDWPGFFQDAIDQAGGRFIEKIGLSRLCSPFKLQLSAAFIPIATFTERSSCTFSQIGVNIDSFLKDFQNGGWIAWQEMVLKPQNNIYGAYLMAWDQYEIEKSAADKAASAEAQAGKGFMSVKGGCIERNFEGYQSCIESGSSAEECDEASCNRRGVITPGAAVGDVAGKALGSDIDYIVNAQDFAAYVGAIVNAVLNRVFAEGVGLLHAGTSGGRRGAVLTPKQQCAPFLGEESYGDCITAIEQCVPSAADYKTCMTTALCAPLSGTPDYEDCVETQAQCIPVWNTQAYDSCITTAKSGTGIGKNQKDFILLQIDQDLIAHNELITALQNLLDVLNESVEILTDLKECQKSEPPELAEVKDAVITFGGQLTTVQSSKISLKNLREEVDGTTDMSKIAAFQARVDKEVDPSTTQRLVLATDTVTEQRKIDRGGYQADLDACSATQ